MIPEDFAQASPGPLTLSERVKTSLVLLVPIFSLYPLIGVFPLGTVREVPMTRVDEFIAVFSPTVWIYLSYFVIFPGTFFILKERRSLRKYAHSLALVAGFSFAVFFFFPTHLTPPNIIGDSLSDRTLRLIYWIDEPTNCFPSMHVAVPLIAAHAIYDEDRGKGALAFLWAALIAISTLTTKQHLFVDAVGGVIVWLGARLLVGRLVPREPRPPSSSAL